MGALPRGILGAALLGLITMGVPGCGGLDILAPDIEDIVNANPFHYEETNLGPAQLEERMKQIDETFAEPRTFGSVFYSYEKSLGSISSQNNFAALWRGARACAWIAMDPNTDRSRRREFAGKGIAIGREAVRKASTSAESFYYLALSLGALADIHQNASRDQLRDMSDQIKMALALNEKLDNCGPHRFLGQLMVETDASPLHAVGSMKQGLAHLEKATALCPDYGENHLAFARALKEDGQDDLARAELEKTITCPRPRDRSAEHDSWLVEANQLLTDLQGK